MGIREDLHRSEVVLAKGHLALGLDPGKSGGLAVVDIHGNAIAWKMPETERDISDLCEAVSEYKPFAAIEKVHAMPKQGVKSTFTFGHGYGGLRMALICNRIRFEEVTPRKWQADLGCPTAKKDEPKTKHKNALKGKAQQWFPDLRVTLSTCDALLIAEWARRKFLVLDFDPVSPIDYDR